MIVIDPGASGGIVTEDESQTSAIKMPGTDGELREIIRDAADNAIKTAYLEDLVKYAGTAMPSSAMAVYASNWGIIKGMLLMADFRLIMVPPKKWQKVLGLGSATGMTKTQWKNKLKNMAEQLYPNIKVTLATADALLILEAAKRGGLG